jgi:glucuronoarabinoxylan endo-1,4-beta-xylanase
MNFQQSIRGLCFVLFIAIAMSGCSKDSVTEPEETSTQAIIYVNNVQQIIRGFGAANILPWRPDMTTNEINKAFGTGNGQIGFTILRLRVPSDTNEFNLNVTTAQLAHSMGVTIIDSPWSPPAWMKTNNNIVGGRLNDTSYVSYAIHLKSFVDYMASNGVPLYAISVQNEPDVNVAYESCDWNASQMLRFVKENAPTIGTKVIAPESANFSRQLSDPLLNDATALVNLDILGGHIYDGGLEPYPLAESKGKEVWMTEHLVLETDWQDNLATGKEILDCMNAGMSAYIWWYIVRFYGPIYDDGSHPDTPPGAVPGEISKRGYVMSNFARFIRPGFYRIDATSNPQANVFITAFKNGSKIVIVVVNNGSSSVEQTFILQNGTAAKFTPYVTSETKNCNHESDIAMSNGSFIVTLEASSITTFVSD